MIMRKPVAARTRPPRSRRAASGRRVPLWPLLLGLLVLAAVVGGILLTRGGGDEPTTGNGGTPAKLTGVASFDPHGDNEEHSERVADATDGDPATYWTTESYQAFTKEGVGLVLRVAGGEAAQVVVTTDTPGYTAEIRAGGSAQGPFDEVVAGAKTVAERTTWTLDTDAQFLAIWITRLDRVAHVNEARAG
jgi:hypothetical protein